MPLTHIEMPIIGDALIEDGQTVGIIQKRINLPPSHEYAIETIDIFDDNGSLGILVPSEAIPTAVVYYISPYPIGLTDMGWGDGDHLLQNQGPNAGNDQVLFKKIGTTEYEPGINGTKIWVWSQYPTAQIASVKGKKWYSPHVYVTALFYAQPPDTYHFNFSVSIAVHMRKISRLLSMKMNYQEHLSAQMTLLEDTAVNIPESDWVGQTYPMWTMGGLRPELVMNATDVLTYFSDSELLNPETATSRTALEGQFIASRTAVGFDEAFGSQPLDLPVWLNITASGISTGPLREQWPPNKYADNGNTLTF